MKKIGLLMAFAVIFSASFAQTEQGRMMVGGSLGLVGNTAKAKNNNTTTTQNKEVAFSLTPQFGYFVINNLAIGLGLNLSSDTYKVPNTDYKSNTTAFQVQPFVRYYLPMKIFFQGTAGIGSSRDKTTNYNNVTTTSKSGVSSLSLGAGYAWFLNNNVAIEPFVGYSTQRTKPENSSTKYLDSGLFLKVGFQIYLGK
ncbi:MAG TPA: outer membrane beta-barrel protein [Cyclobacteriaceae bacterium]